MKRLSCAALLVTTLIALAAGPSITQEGPLEADNSPNLANLIGP